MVLSLAEQNFFLQGFHFWYWNATFFQLSLLNNTLHRFTTIKTYKKSQWRIIVNVSILLYVGCCRIKKQVARWEMFLQLPFLYTIIGTVKQYFDILVQSRERPLPLYEGMVFYRNWGSFLNYARHSIIDMLSRLVCLGSFLNCARHSIIDMLSGLVCLGSFPNGFSQRNLTTK